ncbi:hypothetical protein F5B20DRAFT_589304 [Whalleya microplaca]|nr:hypothetical protein F5B20DRAFT_589304 [Whalleya microplaca]
MASGTHARHQLDITSTICPSVEQASDSGNLVGNCESNDTDYKPIKTKNLPRQETLTPEPKPYDPETYLAWGRKRYGEEWYEYRNSLIQEGKTVVLVLGEQMTIPQTFDPNTYDPDRRMPWTPEPEPYDPETYTAWGKKHFGDEWYEQRKTMLQERNPYMVRDRVYKERQRALRVLEHTIEGRPFKPRSGILDHDWQLLWARLSKDISRIGTPPTPESLRSRDGDSDLSGFSTYPPTPEDREPTPPPKDPWERLEFNRERFRWDTEQYHFHTIFLKEALIDAARRHHEDEEGDKQREEELEELQKIKYEPGTMMISWAYANRKRKFDLRADGWTQEQVEAKERAEKAYAEECHQHYLRMTNPAPLSEPRDQQDMNERPRSREATGASDEKQGESSRPANLTSRKTRSGRVTKKAPQRQSGGLRSTGPRQSTPVRPEALPSNRDNAQPVPQGRPRQHKTYEKQRASRRLAGQLPEYGMLPERGEAPPLYKSSLRQMSNARKANTLGPRSSGPPKKPTETKGVKDSTKRKGAGRPKGPAKGSRG